MLNVDRKNDEVMYTVCICFAIAMLNYLKLRAKKKHENQFASIMWLLLLLLLLFCIFRFVL